MRDVIRVTNVLLLLWLWKVVPIDCSRYFDSVNDGSSVMMGG